MQRNSTSASDLTQPLLGTQPTTPSTPVKPKSALKSHSSTGDFGDQTPKSPEGSRRGVSFGTKRSRRDRDKPNEEALMDAARNFESDHTQDDATTTTLLRISEGQSNSQHSAQSGSSAGSVIEAINDGSKKNDLANTSAHSTVQGEITKAIETQLQLFLKDFFLHDMTGREFATSIIMKNFYHNAKNIPEDTRSLASEHKIRKIRTQKLIQAEHSAKIWLKQVSLHKLVDSLRALISLNCPLNSFEGQVFEIHVFAEVTNMAQLPTYSSATAIYEAINHNYQQHLSAARRKSKIISEQSGHDPFKALLFQNYMMANHKKLLSEEVVNTFTADIEAKFQLFAQLLKNPETQEDHNTQQAHATVNSEITANVESNIQYFANLYFPNHAFGPSIIRRNFYTRDVINIQSSCLLKTEDEIRQRRRQELNAVNFCIADWLKIEENLHYLLQQIFPREQAILQYYQPYTLAAILFENHIIAHHHDIISEENDALLLHKIFEQQKVFKQQLEIIVNTLPPAVSLWHIYYLLWHHSQVLLAQPNPNQRVIETYTPFYAESNKNDGHNGVTLARALDKELASRLSKVFFKQDSKTKQFTFKERDELASDKIQLERQGYVEYALYFTSVAMLMLDLVTASKVIKPALNPPGLTYFYFTSIGIATLLLGLLIRKSRLTSLREISETLDIFSQKGSQLYSPSETENRDIESQHTEIKDNETTSLLQAMQQMV